MNRTSHVFRNKEFICPCLLVLVFALVLVSSFRWAWQTALMPAIAAGFGIIFGVYEIVKVTSKQKPAAGTKKEKQYTGDLTYETVSLRQAVIFFAWVGAFFLGVLLFGFHVSIPLFAFLYLKVEGKASWLLSILLPLFLLGFVLVVFDWLMDIAWGKPLLLSWLQKWR
jgi:hypothetical protein